MTELSFNEDRRMLADSARRYVERGYPAAQRKASVAHQHGCLPAVWRGFGEFGWLALALSEADGGLGCGLADVCVVAEALGSGAVNEPFIASGVLAIGLFAQLASDQAKAAQLPAMLAGDQRIALAHAPGLVATPCGDGFRITGESGLVLGGAGAAGYLVAATVAGGDTAALLLQDGAPGMSVCPCALYDGQRAARLVFDGAEAPAPLWCGPAAALHQALAQALDRASIAHCAESVGAMQSAYQITLDYLKIRKQFGQPIAANQVVQHRLVDLFVEIEEARALTFAAADRFDQADTSADTRSRYAAAAKACTAHAAKLVWKEAVQLHGAIGITEECGVGPFVKRLAAAATLYGSENAQLERLAVLSLGALPTHPPDRTTDAITLR